MRGESRLAAAPESPTPILAARQGGTTPELRRLRASGELPPRSAGAWAALENARWVIEEEERLRRWPDAGRLWVGLVLAPRLEVCEALLAGDDVPEEALDPLWRARLGWGRSACA